jgi:hypothetical protein
VCWDADRQRAVRTVHRLWPNERLPGELAQILPAPEHVDGMPAYARAGRAAYAAPSLSASVSARSLVTVFQLRDEAVSPSLRSVKRAASSESRIESGKWA